MHDPAVTILVSHAFSFAICIFAWMKRAVLDVPLSRPLRLNETEFSLLAAAPCGAYRENWDTTWLFRSAVFVFSGLQTASLGHAVYGPREFAVGLTSTLFAALLFIVAGAMAIGKASVSKFISAVWGAVGFGGGLGGYIVTVALGAAIHLTGGHAGVFMLLYGTVCVSLVCIHFSFRPEIRRGTEIVASSGVA